MGFKDFRRLVEDFLLSSPEKQLTGHDNDDRREGGLGNTA